jgi:hypothetical protein
MENNTHPVKAELTQPDMIIIDRTKYPNMPLPTAEAFRRDPKNLPILIITHTLEDLGIKPQEQQW